MNFIKRLISSPQQEDLAVVPAGQLYLTRSPDSPQGAQECIFNDALATIRRLSDYPFTYQLVIKRVYDEGEEDLEDADESGDLDDDDDTKKDDYAFLLDECLHLSYASRDDRIVISWKDIYGEPHDRYEFVCDDTVKPKALDQFDETAKKCQYERKYKKEFHGTSKDLEEFEFESEEDEKEKEKEAQIQNGLVRTITAEERSSRSMKTAEETPRVSTDKELYQSSAISTKQPEQRTASSEISTGEDETETLEETPKGRPLCSEAASLHFFDAATSMFVEQADDVIVTILDLGKFAFWLDITQSQKQLLGAEISTNLNPVFNYEHFSFIFNVFSDTGSFSWLLKFPTFKKLEDFQRVFMQAVWEIANQKKWGTATAADQQYLEEAFGEMKMDVDAENSDDLEEEEYLEQEAQQPPETYDEDEEHDDPVKFDVKGKNSSLAVGTFNDRSYVVRGNKIGVFRQANSDRLEFSTTIDQVADLSGKVFSPDKVMLHVEDSAMILQNKDDLNKLYKMDLNYGKVVEEWRANEHAGITSYAPDSKFAQRTGNQTFVATTANQVFRMDPRLSGDKMVQAETSSLASKVGFSALSTTESGHLAVASLKGDIRLYDRLGIRAKAQLPALGDEIIGIDVTAEGRWILATCKTYLLLIDTLIQSGPKAGKSGFKGFTKDSKPRPRRLQISPEHVAYMQSESKRPLSFTKAHFNSGIEAKEHMLVTSSGPYVITWSLNKVLRNDKEPYLIKRYASQVTADNFAFGTDKRVIVSLEDDVAMVNRKTFRKPTRESLANPSSRF